MLEDILCDSELVGKEISNVFDKLKQPEFKKQKLSESRDEGVSSEILNQFNLHQQQHSHSIPDPHNQNSNSNWDDGWEGPFPGS